VRGQPRAPLKRAACVDPLFRSTKAGGGVSFAPSPPAATRIARNTWSSAHSAESISGQANYDNAVISRKACLLDRRAECPSVLVFIRVPLSIDFFPALSAARTVPAAANGGDGGCFCFFPLARDFALVLLPGAFSTFFRLSRHASRRRG
jgi:hypothetical protein